MCKKVRCKPLWRKNLEYSSLEKLCIADEPATNRGSISHRTEVMPELGMQWLSRTWKEWDLTWRKHSSIKKISILGKCIIAYINTTGNWVISTENEDWTPSMDPRQFSVSGRGTSATLKDPGILFDSLSLWHLVHQPDRFRNQLPVPPWQLIQATWQQRPPIGSPATVPAPHTGCSQQQGQWGPFENTRQSTGHLLISPTALESTRWRKKGECCCHDDADPTAPRWNHTFETTHLTCCNLQNLFSLIPQWVKGPSLSVLLGSSGTFQIQIHFCCWFWSLDLQSSLQMCTWFVCNFF